MRKLDTAMWVSWNERAESEKKEAKKTDTDLSVEVSELVGYSVSRGLVNAWFKGRRTPSIDEFMALCAALGADPGHVLFNVRMSYKPLPEGSQTAIALQERAPTPPYLKPAQKRLRPKRPKSDFVKSKSKFRV